MLREDNRERADQSRAGRFGVQLAVLSLDFSDMAEYLPKFDSVDDFHGQP